MCVCFFSFLLHFDAHSKENKIKKGYRGPLIAIHVLCTAVAIAFAIAIAVAIAVGDFVDITTSYASANIQPIFHMCIIKKPDSRNQVAVVLSPILSF